MRILYVSQYFPPEMSAPAGRVHEFAREWVRLGHQVTVLTAFAHHPTGKKASEDRWVLTRRESLDGIDVLRAYVYATPNRGVVKRMMSYSSFMISAMIVGRLRVARPDVVLATSPQLLCAYAGYSLSRALRSPFVFEVRDLWPESILAVEAMKENFLIRQLKSMAKLLYRRAHCIVTPGAGYGRKIRELYGIAKTRMHVIPNGIDKELFVPGTKGNPLRRQYGWGDRFVILYLGTHGMAHALNKVLEVAQQFADDQEKLFVFVGEGAEKESLKRQAAELRLTNVQFIDQQPKSRVPLFYAACDLGLVTLRDTPLFQEVLPSKIFEYLGMERPILLSVDGEARKIVEAAGAGRFVPPENVPAMVEAIKGLSCDREQLDRMGRRGRRHVLQHFDRQVLARHYAELLTRVAREFRARAK